MTDLGPTLLASAALLRGHNNNKKKRKKKPQKNDQQSMTNKKEKKKRHYSLKKNHEKRKKKKEKKKKRKRYNKIEKAEKEREKKEKKTCERKKNKRKKKREKKVTTLKCLASTSIKQTLRLGWTLISSLAERFEFDWIFLITTSGICAKADITFRINNLARKSVWIRYLFCFVFLMTILCCWYMVPNLFFNF